MAKRPLDDVKTLQVNSCTETDTRSSTKSQKHTRSRGSNQFVVTTETEEIAERKLRKKHKKRPKKSTTIIEAATEGKDVETEESQSDFSRECAARRDGKRRKIKSTNLAAKQLITPEYSALSTKDVTPIGALDGQYVEDVNLKALPQSDIDKFLADNFITISGTSLSSKVFRPMIKFSYLPNTDPAQHAVLKDYKSPTPIQAAAWPFLFAGSDVIGVAETGSGKTLAFALPCVRSLLSLQKNLRNKGPRALVVSPTRELAIQSYDQIKILVGVSGLKAVCVYGGVAKDEQRKALRTADIVVATPGRLNDLINDGSAVLSKAKYVVLDEADRMLDKGFEDDIKKIISQTMPLGQRQTLMFTATWPESVRSLASTFMTNPVRIAIGDNPEGDLRANNRIVQNVEVVDPRNKEYRLLQLLKQYQSGSQKDDRILVFALYKREATRIEGFIRSKGFRVAGIHGDLSQEQRLKSLNAFKAGTTPILVATDVAARGLDIPAVKLVINCTFPLTVEDYVHRIGRTGRAGNDGLAITLFTEHDKAQSGALINVLRAANQPVPDELLKFGTTVKKKAHEAYGAFFKSVDTSKAAQKIKFD